MFTHNGLGLVVRYKHYKQDTHTKKVATTGTREQYINPVCIKKSRDAALLMINRVCLPTHSLILSFKKYGYIANQAR